MTMWRAAEERYGAWGGGLSSRAVASKKAKTSTKDLAADLFADLLNKQLNGSASSSSRSTTAGAAEAFVAQRISNDFALTAVIALPELMDTAELVLFQGKQRRNGYRLVLAPDGSLTLVRVLSSGATVVAANAKGAVPLRDGRNHTLSWTRTTEGDMVVRLDDTELLTPEDAEVSGTFDGVGLINRGGEIALRSLMVAGRSS